MFPAFNDFVMKCSRYVTLSAAVMTRETKYCTYIRLHMAVFVTESLSVLTAFFVVTGEPGLAGVY